MKTKTMMLALLLCVAVAPACFAKDSYLGTWKLKSVEASITGAHPVLAPNGSLQLAVDAAQTPVDVTTVYEPAGDENVKVTLNGITENGGVVAAHFEWTGKFDGKDYPVKGDPKSDTRSYRVVDDHTLELTLKKDGKVIPGGPIIVSFHGKKCTVKAGGVTAVYHRQ